MQMGKAEQVEDGQVSEVAYSHESDAARQDPLTELEQRWDRLVQTIHDLREENALLQSQLQEQNGKMVHIEQAFAAKAGEVTALSEEKRRTIARVEGLLARFDDLGQ